jgi:lipid A 3-O-deacylase
MHMKFHLTQLGLSIILLVDVDVVHAQEHPADNWEIGVESGFLRKIKHNSPLDYTIVPTQVLWRTPSGFELWRGSNGARLAVRQRFSIVTEVVLKGAEDYYLAIAGSPSVELWSADKKTALFYEIGGGAGLINSKNIPGAQGQNFTLNWFSQLGYRHQLDKKMALTTGIYFTHHSNLGMTKPNPGIDVLGLNFGIVWQLK